MLWVIHRAARALLAVLLLSTVVSCVSYTNFYDGINAFKAQDYRRAFVRLKPEAVKGQPDAQYAIGYMYYYGKGVVEDRQQAWRWITRAAKKGQPDAVAAANILINQQRKGSLYGTNEERH